MKARLYVNPGSHPCAAVEAALALKSIDYNRVDLLPLARWPSVRCATAGAPCLGCASTASAWLARARSCASLDELVPEPPLLPAPGDPSYAQVLEAERWGDEVFQVVPRHILDVAFLRRSSAMESYAGDAKLPLPRALMRPALPLTARLMALKNKATDASARADIDALPAKLDRIDAWIADGLLGGDPPNAADLQIGSTIRLLHTIADLRPLIDGRPAARLTRYFPPSAGEIPAGVLPAEWLPAPASV